MTWRIEWEAQANRDLRRLSDRNRKRIVAAIARLGATEEGDVKRLAGYAPPQYRLRVGDVRVLLQFEGDTAVILRVLHRREAYR